MTKKMTLDNEARQAMRRPYRKFIEDCGGKSEFTNGYTWGFIEGYKVAMRKRVIREKRKP